ncbi:MAG TPA: ATP-binding protein [Pyrinomonadaceae bacterium]|nr:ATP-binding protein [Pyrinomonadaceae bacterium]
MSPLEVLQLVGYSIGAVLPLWMGYKLVSQRHRLTSPERVLFAVALTMGGWHTSNLLITLHSLLGLSVERWTPLLRLADSVAVVSITFAYSFLLHVHLHLWANAHDRLLTRTEKIRVYLSYLPTVAIFWALWLIWTGPYAPMLTKLRVFVIPFALWIAYVLGLIAVTELLIARKSTNRSEQRIMRTLAASFVAIGLVILAALALGLGKGTTLGLYLHTIANLGSLLPSVLLAYYIYRYRYLELIIEESLIVATFAAVVLTVYLFGIRTIGDWMAARYGIRQGVIEALLILGLTLAAAPLRRWLAIRFHKLFEHEAAFYRDIVARVGSHAGQYQQLPELLQFVEERTAQALGLRRVRIIVTNAPAGDASETVQPEPWVEQVLEVSRNDGWQPVQEHPALSAGGFQLAYPLRREDRVSGLMLIDGPSASLTPDAQAVLEVLAGQVAIAIEDCRLVEENVRLERRVAEGERLAALGQMAAAVAHEIKNPLSAIKSIAQVMREDAELNAEYARDLSLIVGETDRLSQSVTQLLSFARRDKPEELPLKADELVRSVVELFKANAAEHGVVLETRLETDRELTGAAVSTLRDALSNLILNALQATPAGGLIAVTAREDKNAPLPRINGTTLVITVTDTGTGVPAELRQRIWEPFFTTKQRGTGLGLAIVRKRMEEVGGSARLVPSHNGTGSRFELKIPIE